MAAEASDAPERASAPAFALGATDPLLPVSLPHSAPPAAGAGSAAPAEETSPARRIPMLSLLRDVEFRVLSITQFVSIAGDQLARVALSVLVFDRTNSALQAAIAYALTFVPGAIGGPLLSGLADRRPRRSVMIVADLVRAPLIGLIAIPSMPLPLAMTLLALAGLFEAPFDAARGALLPDVLQGDRYTAGYAFAQITVQGAQVGGFAIAGVLLIALSPAVLLVVDAATFVVSAALIVRFVRWRPAAHVGPADARPEAWWTHAFSDAQTSVRIVLKNARVRPLAMLAWASSTFAISFEALGAPLSRDSGSGRWSVGLLLAAQPIGTVLGATLVSRVPAERRQPAMQLLAALTMVPLMLGLLRPALAPLMLLGVLSGVGMSFNVLASTAFVSRVAPEVRGRALGLVGTGLFIGQGLGAVIAGALATAVDARVAVGWLGIGGTVAVLATLFDAHRHAQLAERN